MRRKIALWTEWAWSQGHLNTDEDVLLWSQLIFRILAKSFPNSQSLSSQTLSARGQAEIAITVRQILRCLRYGQQNPKDILTARLHRLSQRTETKELQGELRNLNVNLKAQPFEQRI